MLNLIKMRINFNETGNIHKTTVGWKYHSSHMENLDSQKLICIMK